jgi:hypothetical protein
MARSAGEDGPGIGDEVIYNLKRWDVIDRKSAVQVPGQPHRPGKLRLVRWGTGRVADGSTNEAVWAPEDQVVLTTGRQ